MKLAVILPCYNSCEHVMDVIGRIGPEVSHIIAVDDACPHGTGEVIQARNTDPRVTLLRHDTNKGVGGAVMTGYAYALEQTDAQIFIKIDSDGQMDPDLVPRLIAPIANGYADYTKGNRFFHPSNLRDMPRLRLFGNAALSFLTKLSSGYYSIMDPTNGFTALHRTAAEQLELERISQRYFFESDMLHHLNLTRAVVVDMPMSAVYGEEESGLSVRAILGPFLGKNIRNILRRVFFDYGLRNFSIGSSYLFFSIILIVFGVAFGLVNWTESIRTGEAATSGTVMIAGLPIIVGIQFLNAFVSYDIANAPRTPLQIVLRRDRRSEDDVSVATSAPVISITEKRAVSE